MQQKQFLASVAGRPVPDGFEPNGWISDYPHSDLGKPCSGPCCEPDEYENPYPWRCQGQADCKAKLVFPGECVTCDAPLTDPAFN